MKVKLPGAFKLKTHFFLIPECFLVLVGTVIAMGTAFANPLASSQEINSLTGLPLTIQRPPQNRSIEKFPKYIHSWKAVDKSKATLICVHALGLSSHAYNDLAEKFSSDGYDVYAIDVRGFGYNRNLSGRNKLDLNRTVNDIKSLIETVKNSNKNQPVFLIGESMGGAVVLKAASTYPELISGILVSAPAYKLFKLKRLTLKGLGDLILPGTGPAANSVIVQATSSLKLRHHWRNDNCNHKLALSFGEAISYYKFVRNTPKYSTQIRSVPVCIMHGLHDNLAKPTGSARLFNDVGSTDKLLVIDCQAEHILLEEEQLTNRIQILATIWLKQHIDNPGKSNTKRIIVLNDQLLNSVDKAKLKEIKSVSGVIRKNTQVSRSAPML